jgi:hypothetical protein
MPSDDEHTLLQFWRRKGEVEWEGEWRGSGEEGRARGRDNLQWLLIKNTEY